MRIKEKRSGDLRKRRRSSRRAGFTLVELLLSLLIVAMLSLMLVSGTQLAARANVTVTDQANAEVLLSTCVTMLRNELGTAAAVTVGEDGKDVTFQRGSTGYVVTIRSGAETSGGTGSSMDKIMITEYGTERPFISDVTATGGLCISFGEIEWSDGKFTITDLTVRKPGRSDPLTQLDTLVISGGTSAS